MKLNLGCGHKHEPGFVNIDHDASANPDYVINLDDVNIKLPFEDSTVTEVRAYHILEHIGAGFIPLMKELYRVCAHGAIFDIICPHHFHDVFYGDPTHVRPITVPCMTLFGKKYCKFHNETYGSHNGIALQHNIDFDVVWFDFEYDQFYAGMIADFKQRKEEGKVSQEEDFMVTRLLREATNVALNIKIKMMAVKE
jgi:SAM-dependent methyltransferase